MDAFLELSTGDRCLACLQVEDRMRLQAASVEKDYWVCWILREIVDLPSFGEILGAIEVFQTRFNSESSA